MSSSQVQVLFAGDTRRLPLRSSRPRNSQFPGAPSSSPSPVHYRSRGMSQRAAGEPWIRSVACVERLRDLVVPPFHGSTPTDLGPRTSGPGPRGRAGQQPGLQACGTLPGICALWPLSPTTCLRLPEEPWLESGCGPRASARWPLGPPADPLANTVQGGSQFSAHSNDPRGVRV